MSTAVESAAEGKAARSAARRSSHAGFEAPTDREDPVAILERQAESRLPDLVPIRYGRMAASPFAFLRGAAAIMAEDFAGLPSTGILPAGRFVTICPPCARACCRLARWISVSRRRSSICTIRTTASCPGSASDRAAR